MCGHPGTGSWLCWKMFFLEAGSYVLPRRNENKAPKGSHGVRWEPRWAIAVLSALLGRKLEWGLCLELQACRRRPRRALSGAEGRTYVLPLSWGTLCHPLLLLDHLHGQHRWRLYPLPLNLCWRLEGAQEKGPANLESKFWLSSDERAILRQTASFLGVAGLSCELRCTLFSSLHFLTPLTLSSLTFPTRFR